MPASISEMNRYAATGVDLAVRAGCGGLRSLLRRRPRHVRIRASGAIEQAAVLCDSDRPGRSRHQRRPQGRRARPRARSPWGTNPGTVRRGQFIRLGLRRLLPGCGRDSGSGADVCVHCRQRYRATATGGRIAASTRPPIRRSRQICTLRCSCKLKRGYLAHRQNLLRPHAIALRDQDASLRSRDGSFNRSRTACGRRGYGRGGALPRALCLVPCERLDGRRGSGVIGVRLRGSLGRKECGVIRARFRKRCRWTLRELCPPRTTASITDYILEVQQTRGRAGRRFEILDAAPRRILRRR